MRAMMSVRRESRTVGWLLMLISLRVVLGSVQTDTFAHFTGDLNNSFST